MNNGPNVRLRQTGNSQHRFQGHTFGEHRLSNTQRFGPQPLLNALKSSLFETFLATFPLPLPAPHFADKFPQPKRFARVNQVIKQRVSCLSLAYPLSKMAVRGSIKPSQSR